MAALGYASQGYDESQRAFVLSRTLPRSAGTLRILLDASTENPLVDLAFVIKNRGTGAPGLTIDGHPVNRGSSFRHGVVPRLERNGLVVWLELTFAKPVRLEIGTLNP